MNLKTISFKHIFTILMYIITFYEHKTFVNRVIYLKYQNYFLIIFTFILEFCLNSNF